MDRQELEKLTAANDYDAAADCWSHGRLARSGRDATPSILHLQRRRSACAGRAGFGYDVRQSSGCGWGLLSAFAQAGVAAKVADDVALVTKNRIAGNEFRDLVASRLEADEGFAVLGKEVGVKTPFGMRYMDILAQRNGGLVNFETKLGGSRYLPSQRAKDWWISRVGVDLGDGGLTQIPTVLIRGPL